VILLDTNAFIWLESAHARAASLPDSGLVLSPASVLELAYLAEIGKLRPTHADFLHRLAHHPRVKLDQPPATAWFLRAAEQAWTRDPFDRLIAAHALQRGWRLATGDRKIVDQLGPDRTIYL